MERNIENYQRKMFSKFITNQQGRKVKNTVNSSIQENQTFLEHPLQSYEVIINNNSLFYEYHTQFFCTVYIGNECGGSKIVWGNITVQNGVIHMVDGFLGFRQHNVLQYLTANNDLR